MTRVHRFSVLVGTIAALGCASSPRAADTPPAADAAPSQEVSQKVVGGGIMVAGWSGQIDAKETAAGQVLANSKLDQMGNALHVTTGPAVVYWNTAAKATGNYTVQATFTEPKFMALNDHPHPYGIAIGGNDMGTDKQSYLYCAAYGTGTFIVRGFGPASFQLNGRGTPHESVHKATAKGEPVTNRIAITVKDDKVSCAINGTTVAEYDKAAVVGEGKLKSTDGMYGMRFGHNTEAMVSGLTLTKQ